MEQAGLKMIELDAGCPHPDEMKDGRETLIRDITYAANLTKTVKEAVSIPVVYKLTPQQSDLLQTAKAIKANGGDAVVVNNRFLGFLVDIETGKPHADGWAGVGGPWILPLSLRWVSKIYKDVDIQISGSAGPKDWRDVVQFMMSGATTVQFCSAVMVRGYDIVPRIIKGFGEFLEKKGYKSSDEIIGIAANAALEYSDMYDLKRYAVIDYDTCTDCKRCLKTCWYHGNEWNEEKVVIKDSCIGCGICKAVCPVRCITMTGDKIPFKKPEPQVWPQKMERLV
jgi:dihydroorotate dehydrogenase (fumarate)/dihydropyrimidine dehydrogenase (NAD+) subunit PreA